MIHKKDAKSGRVLETKMEGRSKVKFSTLSHLFIWRPVRVFLTVQFRTWSPCFSPDRSVSNLIVHFRTRSSSFKPNRPVSNLIIHLNLLHDRSSKIRYFFDWSIFTLNFSKIIPVFYYSTGFLSSDIVSSEPSFGTSCKTLLYSQHHALPLFLDEFTPLVQKLHEKCDLVTWKTHPFRFGIFWQFPLLTSESIKLENLRNFCSIRPNEIITKHPHVLPTNLLS